MLYGGKRVAKTTKKTRKKINDEPKSSWMTLIQWIAQYDKKLYNGAQSCGLSTALNSNYTLILPSKSDIKSLKSNDPIHNHDIIAKKIIPRRVTISTLKRLHGLRIGNLLGQAFDVTVDGDDVMLNGVKVVADSTAGEIEGVSTKDLKYGVILKLDGDVKPNEVSGGDSLSYDELYGDDSYIDEDELEEMIKTANKKLESRVKENYFGGSNGTIKPPLTLLGGGNFIIVGGPPYSFNQLVELYEVKGREALIIGICEDSIYRYNAAISEQPGLIIDYYTCMNTGLMLSLAQDGYRIYSNATDFMNAVPFMKLYSQYYATYDPMALFVLGFQPFYNFKIPSVIQTVPTESLLAFISSPYYGQFTGTFMLNSSLISLVTPAIHEFDIFGGVDGTTNSLLDATLYFISAVIDTAKKSIPEDLDELVRNLSNQVKELFKKAAIEARDVIEKYGGKELLGGSSCWIFINGIRYFDWTCDLPTVVTVPLRSIIDTTLEEVMGIYKLVYQKGDVRKAGDKYIIEGEYKLEKKLDKPPSDGKKEDKTDKKSGGSGGLFGVLEDIHDKKEGFSNDGGLFGVLDEISDKKTESNQSSHGGTGRGLIEMLEYGLEKRVGGNDDDYAMQRFAHDIIDEIAKHIAESGLGVKGSIKLITNDGDNNNEFYLTGEVTGQLLAIKRTLQVLQDPNNLSILIKYTQDPNRNRERIINFLKSTTGLDIEYKREDEEGRLIDESEKLDSLLDDIKRTIMKALQRRFAK
jgi:hypothetical protein